MKRIEPKLSRRSRRVRYTMRKAIAAAIGFAIVLAVVVGDRLGLFGRRPPAAAGDHTRYHGKAFRVGRVIDGDTIDVDAPDGKHARTRVRLWGVDTPETKHPHKPVEHFGPEASAFTRRACRGRSVRLELVRASTRDRYGRLLAYVILPDGTMLNRRLVRLGYGYADPRYGHPQKAEFMRLQDEAKAARRGLWRNLRREDLPYYWRDKLKLPPPQPGGPARGRSPGPRDRAGGGPRRVCRGWTRASGPSCRCAPPAA